MESKIKQKVLKEVGLNMEISVEEIIDLTLAEVGKEYLDGDKIYPKDVFPEIRKVDLEIINQYLKENFGFPLDRLSACISRRLLQGIKKELGIRNMKGKGNPNTRSQMPG